MSNAASQPKLPRYVELVRVSTTGQADRDTPQVQRAALDKLREKRPGVLVERIEHGASGLSGALGVSERPDLQRLAQLAKTHAFDELRVYDLDRLTRADDPRERFAIFGMCLDTQAIIVDRSGRETNPQDGMGEIDYFLRTFFSAQERKKIFERTMGGRKGAAGRGHKASGSTPYGLAYDKATKFWSIDEPRAEIVRRIFRMAAEGVTITNIKARLDGEGILSPSGRPWNRSVIHEWIHSPTYTGSKVFGFGESESFTVEVPRLVSDDIAQAARDALARKNKVPVRSAYRVPALLRQRSVCTCGRPLYTDASKGIRYYVCASAKTGGECDARHRHPIQSVDGALWGTLRAVLTDRKWLDKAVAKARGGKSVPSGWQEQIKSCEKKLAEINRKEVSLVRILGNGLAEDACTEQLKTLARQRDTVQRSLAVATKAQAAQAHANAATDALEASLDRLRSKLDSQDFTVQDSVIAALVPDDGKLVTLHRDGTIELHGILTALSDSDEEVGKVSAAPRKSRQFSGLPFRLVAHVERRGNTP